MKNVILLISGLMLLTFTECVADPLSNSVFEEISGDFPDINVTFMKKKDSEKKEYKFNYTEKDILLGNSSILISTNKDTNLSVNVKVEKDGKKLIRPFKYTRLKETPRYKYIYELNISKLEKNNGLIGHGNKLEIKDSTKSLNLLFTRKDIWQWDFGVYTPILLRLNGSDGEYSVENIAPSVAVSIFKYNGKILSQELDPKFSLAVSLYVNEQDDGTKLYQPAVGFLFNILNKFDVGYMYHIKEKENMFVIGSTFTELIDGLFK